MAGDGSEQNVLAIRARRTSAHRSDVVATNTSAENRVCPYRVLLDSRRNRGLSLRALGPVPILEPPDGACP